MADEQEKIPPLKFPYHDEDFKFLYQQGVDVKILVMLNTAEKAGIRFSAPATVRLFKFIARKFPQSTGKAVQILTMAGGGWVAEKASGFIGKTITAAMATGVAQKISDRVTKYGEKLAEKEAAKHAFIEAEKKYLEKLGKAKLAQTELADASGVFAKFLKARTLKTAEKEAAEELTKAAQKALDHATLQAGTKEMEREVAEKALKVTEKEIEELVAKQGEKALEKEGVDAALKISSKMMAKEAGESAAKKIPILGALVGIGFAANDLAHGEGWKALGDASSGIIGGIPGGEAFSVGIDAIMGANDLASAMEAGKAAKNKIDAEHNAIQKEEDKRKKKADQNKKELDNARNAEAQAKQELEDYKKKLKEAQEKEAASTNVDPKDQKEKDDLCKKRDEAKNAADVAQKEADDAKQKADDLQKEMDDAVAKIKELQEDTDKDANELGIITSAGYEDHEIPVHKVNDAMLQSMGGLTADYSVTSDDGSNRKRKLEEAANSAPDVKKQKLSE